MKPEIQKQNTEKKRTDFFDVTRSALYATRSSGQAMLISVLFFLVISLVLVVGFANPVTREFRVAGNIFTSKQAYFLAESGAEDAYYRIKNNKQLPASGTISLGGGQTTVTVTTISATQKNIDSLSDVYGGERKVSLALKTTNGAVFYYGTQSGQAGLTLKNNAGLYGNLYTNGNIYGSNGAFITGNAFVADTPALAADQTNNSPSTPPSSINFGAANASQDLGQSFQLSSGGLINQIQLYIKKTGTPANATIRITADSSGSPSASSIATGTLTASQVTTSYGWLTVSLTTNPFLASGTTYWLVVDGATSSSNYYTVGANAAYANGIAKVGQYGSTWNATVAPATESYFQIYLGGVNSSINNVSIGTNGVGDAHAHTVTNSVIAGGLYCQTGSGNNKACNTSQADPPPLDWPISDGLVTQWKTDAANGTIYTGNVIVSGSQTLGPEKIIGNLTVSGTLTVANTIWVTGTVTINGTVKLASSFGTTTGIILSDSYMTVANNSVFQDSGQSGSYIMLLSTSICDSGSASNPASCNGNDAINLSNNSNIIIANASKGGISFSNNAAVKEVVANRITLQNNATIQYGSGLINVGFTSGPSGGWGVSTWQETQ